MNTTTHAPQIDYIDARRFEERYSLSRRTFFAWIHDGKIEAYRPSKRKTLVKRSDVDQLIESSRTQNNIDEIVNDCMREWREAR